MLFFLLIYSRMINHIFGYQPDILYLSRQKRPIDYTSEEHLCLNYITYYQYFYFYYSSVFSGFFNLLNNSNFNYSHCLDFWLVHKMLILIKENKSHNWNLIWTSNILQYILLSKWVDISHVYKKKWRSFK